MGKGELVVLSSSDTVVNLANIETATTSSGIVYFDQHTRVLDERIAGSPPQIELIMRKKLDCNEMSYEILSGTSRNFHTLKNAEGAIHFGNSGQTRAIIRDTPDHDICTAFNQGNGLFFSLSKNHYFELETFPAFALSYWDSLDIEEVNDEGEITQVSESELLQYLRENNPNF